MQKLFFSGAFVLISFFGFSQTPKADSLMNLVKTIQDDSAVQMNRVLYVQAIDHNFELSEPIINDGISQAKADHDFYFLGSFYRLRGIMYNYVGENDKALADFLTALNYAVFSKDTFGIASCCLSLANVYKGMGNYKTAIEYGLDSEAAFESIADSKGLARAYNTLGLIFKQQKDFSKALEYYARGIRETEVTHDDYVRAGLLDNIGGVYQLMDRYDSAVIYHKEALELRKISGEIIGLGRSYGNLGLVFKDNSQLDSASAYLNVALDYFKQCNFAEGVSLVYSNLGQIALDQEKYKEATNYFKEGEAVALAGNYLPYLVDMSLGLSKCYQNTGNYKEANKYLTQYVELKDSLFNTEKSNEVQKQQIEFEYEKKQLSDSLKLMEQKKIQALQDEKDAVENKRRMDELKLYIYAGVGGFVLVLAIAFILFRNNKRQKKLNGIIAHQKTEVEEKNKEITDSITYAKRIQEAILPPLKLVEGRLPESFILYKPKDIVAGDFYWFEETGKKCFIAAADCTGHGVPGAMVSVVCANALNRTVKEFNITDPGKILDKVRELVIETFQKSEQDVKDGMDIALVSIENNADGSAEIKFAGANNPLWIMRKSEAELQEFKGDSQPIGKFMNQRPFNSHSTRLEKGDSIYFFTDGYQDQFGGEKGKKFKAANLKNLLLSLREKPMISQHTALSTTFADWKGELDQLDDVCIIGVRI